MIAISLTVPASLPKGGSTRKLDTVHIGTCTVVVVRTYSYIIHACMVGAVCK